MKRRTMDDDSATDTSRAKRQKLGDSSDDVDEGMPRSLHHLLLTFPARKARKSRPEGLAQFLSGQKKYWRVFEHQIAYYDCRLSVLLCSEAPLHRDLVLTLGPDLAICWTPWPRAR